MDCARISPEVASRRYPGEIIPPRPRGEYVDRSVLVCTEPVLRPGTRPVRDELILTDLDARAAEVARAVVSRRPDLAERAWLVEAHYPTAPVATKIAFATKNALVEPGPMAVSDRHPGLLAVGDIEVLTRMSHRTDAYPTACRRYADQRQPGTRARPCWRSCVLRDPQRDRAARRDLRTDGRWLWLR